jgi:hypothetical protein
LEFTLQKFRIPKTGIIDHSLINEALEKFLAFDVYELVEHPQWQELISTTLYHLSVDSSSGDIKVKCIHFLMRLVFGLPGVQVV